MTYKFVDKRASSSTETPLDRRLKKAAEFLTDQRYKSNPACDIIRSLMRDIEELRRVHPEEPNEVHVVRP